MLLLSRLLLLTIACATVVGCGNDLRVTGVRVGRSLNTDQTVAAHTTTFGPHDTVYVSINTDGAGSGVLSVRWTYGTQVVGEPKKEISFRGEGVTEFHLQNVGGFPPGEYQVEAFLDGQSVGSRTFRVEKKQ